MTTRVVFKEGRNFDKAVTRIDGQKVDAQRLPLYANEIEIDAASLIVQPDDGLGSSSERISTAGKGLAVFSTYGDRCGSSERKFVDDNESLSFLLDDRNGMGDADEVVFKFAKLSHPGDVELAFFQDGVEVERTILSIANKSVRHELSGGQTFDRVDIGPVDDLEFTLRFVELVRETTDEFVL